MARDERARVTPPPSDYYRHEDELTGSFAIGPQTGPDEITIYSEALGYHRVLMMTPRKLPI